MLSNLRAFQPGGAKRQGTSRVYVPPFLPPKAWKGLTSKAQQHGTHGGAPAYRYQDRIFSCLLPRTPPTPKGKAQWPYKVKSLPLPVALPAPSAYQDPSGTSSHCLFRSRLVTQPSELARPTDYLHCLSDTGIRAPSFLIKQTNERAAGAGCGATQL